MRFLTYNLWHGLSPASPVAFEPLEPTGRRVLREAEQIRLLQELQPDVCFFQECNPVHRRVAEFIHQLNRAAAIQPDLVGLKLFGVGLPLNLNSGLVILATHSVGLKKITGVSLSRPGTHWVQNWGSWQLKEERFALFAEAMLPKWGRVLLVNTHLHHGLESTPNFEARLKDMDLDEQIVDEIHARLAKGIDRRAAELEVLLAQLEKLERRFEVVILAGDFNASPEGGFGNRLRECGFRDVWFERHPEAGGLTFDEKRNPANHFLQERFPLTLVVEDLSFDSHTKEALLALARQQEARPRRIDYIWIRSQSLNLKVTTTELIGLPDAEGLAPSDHFGVCSDIELV